MMLLRYDARRVIGLFSALVVLASGPILLAAPAAAQDGRQRVQPVIVRITTPTVAGEYTVTWQTLGGCDPGAGTSGNSGTVVLTVEAAGAADDTPAPGELTGTAAEDVVVVRPTCIYRWQVSLVEATTDANCVVGPAPFAPDTNNEIRITLADPATSCAQGSRITVRIHPAVAVTVDSTDHNAILATSFRATARRVEGAPTRCSTKTEVSEVDDKETPGDTTDDTVSVELKVVDVTSAGEACRYDVTLRLPSSLTAAHSGHVVNDVDPLAAIDVSVGVVAKTLYVVQNVVGDSGDANVQYAMSTVCGDPSPLPDVLLPGSPSSGIQLVPSETVVELREGRFNITAAIADDPTAEDAFDGVALRVLDNKGEPCEATITVSHLPERCTAEETSLSADLTRSPDETIFEFKITCSDEVEKDTEADLGTGTAETGTAETGTDGDDTAEANTDRDHDEGDPDEEPTDPDEEPTDPDEEPTDTDEEPTDTNADEEPTDTNADDATHEADTDAATSESGSPRRDTPAG